MGRGLPMDAARVAWDDPPVEVLQVPWSDPRLGPLFLALWQELDGLYGPNPGTEFAPRDLDRPGTLAFMATTEAPVGCAALVPWREPGVLEVKRMYVVPAARGSGVAQAILRALEAAARARGSTALTLETGTRQPAALALYERAGFVRVPCWGAYARDPLSECYRRAL